MARRVKSRRNRSHKRRSNHRRQARGTVRTKRARQHGGSCAAMPQMNQAFPQRGGMAPITQGDSYLLDAATRVQAEVGPQDGAFRELPSVIPKQMGGRRYRKSGRKSRRSGRRASGRKGRRTYRRQQGGMMDFDAAYRYQPQGGYAGENNQIHTEQTVNPMFKIAGAQA